MDLQSTTPGFLAIQSQEFPESPPSPLKTTTIPRKPAPRKHESITSEFQPSPRSASARYNPWGDPQRNVVNAENYGLRQKLGKIAPQVMQPLMPRHNDDGQPRLSKHQSIDNWIQKRDNISTPQSVAHVEHISPSQVPQWSPRRVESVEPPLLNLNLDFEHIEASRYESHVAETHVTARKLIPEDTSSNHKTTTAASTSDRTDGILRMLSESINKHPQQTSVPQPEPTGPKDHITELEERRDRLTESRVAIRKEIWALEQALDPTGSTRTHLKRSDIRVLMEQKNSELAGIEKEIFDVGMMIHRAWRRRCKNGEEGSTHLWIQNAVSRISE